MLKFAKMLLILPKSDKICWHAAKFCSEVRSAENEDVNLDEIYVEFLKSRSAENEYENGNSEKENGYDTKRNILRKIVLRSRK